MAIALYILGFIVLIGGLAWAANLLGVPDVWIAVGAVILAGFAILVIASSVHSRQPPERRPPPSSTL
ncbi:MAG TPA: hypothetical protein VIL13_12555 [Longimicrobiales bacterium]